jgi:hypothetical protein
MTIQDKELAALIKAGVFRSKKEAVTEALRLMLASRPQLRLGAAVQLFKDAMTSPVLTISCRNEMGLRCANAEGWKPIASIIGSVAHFASESTPINSTW